jgi:hypothetical protein
MVFNVFLMHNIVLLVAGYPKPGWEIEALYAFSIPYFFLVFYSIFLYIINLPKTLPVKIGFGFTLLALIIIPYLFYNFFEYNIHLNAFYLSIYILFVSYIPYGLNIIKIKGVS